MTDRPILFSGPMVRAILSGAKTETRRLCKPAHDHGVPAGSVHPTGSGTSWIAWWPAATAEETVRRYPGDDGFRCPYGVPGDRLWVRETWKAPTFWPETECVGVHYRADDFGPRLCEVGNEQDGPDEVDAWLDRWLNRNDGAWQPSIYMPRWASRLTLLIKSVRVERLHDITDEGARAEGVADLDEYADLWDRINGGGAWAANPWVWVICFSRTGGADDWFPASAVAP